MTAVSVFCALCVLLFIGKIVRMKVTFLQRLYLPSSVVGGLLGLIVVTCAESVLPADFVTTFESEYVVLARKVPGFLINVIFATLFLGAVTPKIKDVIRESFPQLCIGQILAWGQYVVGLGLAGFVFVKCFGVPPAFGNLLEMGFEGGHGTVGGMVESFKAFGWEDGIALGFTMATAGMVIGIVVGMAMIQWAYRKGHVKQVVAFEDRESFERRGIHLRRQRPSAGLQTVMCDSIDSLAWHLAVVGIGMVIGFGMLKGFQFAEVALFPAAKVRVFQGFPLFPLCMIGGVLLQLVAKGVRKDLLIDRGQMERISGAALDFLVVAAVATIQLKVVAANWQPLVILILAGAVWSIWVVLFVAPRVFKDAWFERAIAEFGQATGVTATGLMLLRTVDPQNRTPAAMSFGYKQLLHEPFMGGGIWTALAFTLVYSIGWLNVWLISVVMLIVWGGLAIWVARTGRRG